MTDLKTVQLDSTAIEELTVAAKEAQLNAYCPYSNFPVGAAVLTREGRIFSGCNVENASFGLTICAERNAISAAVAAGSLAIIGVVVVTNATKVAHPCGACRQVIAEFSSQEKSAVVISISSNGETDSSTIDELLPSRFNLL